MTFYQGLDRPSVLFTRLALRAWRLQDRRILIKYSQDAAATSEKLQWVS
jgi:hypothetical protein